MAQAVFSRPSSGCHTKAYRRRRPEETVLYQTVEAHWPEFRERAEEAGGLPRFVVREFEQYLQCGRLEHGCLHLVCRNCGDSQLVAFSCKNRGFCPLCFVMVHLVDLSSKRANLVEARGWRCFRL